MPQWQDYVCVSSPKVEELQDVLIPDTDIVSASHGITLLRFGSSVCLFFCQVKF